MRAPSTTTWTFDNAVSSLFVTQPDSSAGTPAARLGEVGALRDAALLAPDEFDAKKAELLPQL